MKYGRVTSAIALTAFCVAARAENWVEIDRSTHTVVYVDKDSGVRANGHVKYWEKYLLDAPHPIGIYDAQPPTGPNLKGTTMFIEMRYYVDVDCQANTFNSSLQTFYDADGHVVSTMTAAVGPNTMGPNSIALAGAKIMCPQQ
jgi:Surface-adhesin protein E